MPLRIVLNGNLISAEESLYDAFILREPDTPGEEFAEAKLIGQVLSKHLGGLSDGWVALRIEKFIREERLIPVTQPPDGEPIYHRSLRGAHM